MARNPIERCRKALSLTQAEVSIVVGVSPAQVGQWERGELTPGREDVIKLAKAFNIQPDRLTDDLLAFRRRLRSQVMEKLAAVG